MLVQSTLGLAQVVGGDEGGGGGVGGGVVVVEFLALEDEEVAQEDAQLGEPLAGEVAVGVGEVGTVEGGADEVEGFFGDGDAALAESETEVAFAEGEEVALPDVPGLGAAAPLPCGGVFAPGGAYCGVRPVGCAAIGAQDGARGAEGEVDEELAIGFVGFAGLLVPKAGRCIWLVAWHVWLLLLPCQGRLPGVRRL